MSCNSKVESGESEFPEWNIDWEYEAEGTDCEEMDYIRTQTVSNVSKLIKMLWESPPSSNRTEIFNKWMNQCEDDQDEEKEESNTFCDNAVK